MPTVDDFETENGLPNPEVTKHYKIDVQRMNLHEFGTRFIDIRLTFEGLEDCPLPDSLRVLYKILQNVL